MKIRPALGFFDRRIPADRDMAAEARKLRRHGVEIMALLGPWHDHAGYRLPVPLDRSGAFADALAEENIERWVYGWPRWEAPGEQSLGQWARDMSRYVARCGAEVALIDLEDPTLLGNAVDEVRVETLYRILRDELREGTRIAVTYMREPETPGIAKAITLSWAQMLQTYKGSPERATARLKAARAAGSDKLRLFAATPCFTSSGGQGGPNLSAFLEGVTAAEPELLMGWDSVHASDEDFANHARVTRGSLAV